MTFKRKPEWLRMPERGSGEAAVVRSVLRRYSLDTVCRQAKCPNLDHCFQRGTATFLILGSECTRSCRYCAIDHADSAPAPPDPDEPRRVAEASAEMGLRYVVVTSVTRDDLDDGGASHFARTVRALRKSIAGVVIEVLTPDFSGSVTALETVARSCPDVFNHNLETVDRLFPEVRPEASCEMSLKVLSDYGRLSPETPLKSGLMLGLGETGDEIERALAHLRERGVTMLTLGQYLQPSRRHWPVDRFLTPEEFARWGEVARSMGFISVASGPLVRSSFHADVNYAGQSFPSGSSSL
ncbi:MAG: lipoyl synthase [Candidatus Aegiribacteria sp.]